jgi:hypothetical protein
VCDEFLICKFFTKEKREREGERAAERRRERRERERKREKEIERGGGRRRQITTLHVIKFSSQCREITDFFSKIFFQPW